MRALCMHEQSVDRIFHIIFSQFLLALHWVAKMQGCISVVLKATISRDPSIVMTGTRLEIFQIITLAGQPGE